MCNLEISETSTKISAISDTLKISDILFYVADIINVNGLQFGLIYLIFLIFKKL